MCGTFSSGSARPRLAARRDEEARGISAEELHELLAGGNGPIEHQLHYFASSLHGTPQWKRARRSELLDLIEEVGMPTFFLTTSAAARHWPDLQLLMMQQEGAATDGSVVDDGRNDRVVRCETRTLPAPFFWLVFSCLWSM